MSLAYKLYVVDIEGTVAPLSLVTEQLFPYARRHFETFLRKNFADFEKSPESVREDTEGSVFWDIVMLGLENRAEKDPDAPRILPKIAHESENLKAVSMSPAYGIPRILAYIYWLMDRDRKSTALKSLQGKIWKAGFESGELKGTLFPDVPEAFARWSASSQVVIYSSGSVEAQQLLFRYSNYGDLTAHISGYFDTRTGPKKESASYVAITAAMHVDPAEVIFFSDVVGELDAAREARLATRLVVREGNAQVEDAHGHNAVESLALV
jgi:2,3-diketo-5-methylthio-1-phosphopentane phosphatase